MFSILLYLFVADLFAIAICVVISKRLLSLILSAIAILLFLWLFTSVPIRIGLIKLPIIEHVKIRATTDDDYLNRLVYEKDGVIEFVSDKNLNEFDIRTGYLLRLTGTNRPNLTYQDIYKDIDSFMVLISNNVHLEKQIDNKYLYKAVFNRTIPVSEMPDTIYCKVFFVQMLATIFGTNEIRIPRDSLLLVAGEAERRGRE